MTGRLAAKGGVDPRQTDRPSRKYSEVECLTEKELARAQTAPSPTKFTQQSVRSWITTEKQRHPAESPLIGTGKAGKQGELHAKDGSKYVGEVSAGLPHGSGKNLVPKGGTGPGFFVEYDGEWERGYRQGQGTRYYLNGEVYVGGWQRNQRQGHGRLEYASGDVFEGEWRDDKRTGPGTYYHHNKDVFTGHYVADRRAGLGTLFLVEKGKKLVAEYVDDRATNGTMLPIDNSDLEPLRGPLGQTLTTLVLQHRIHETQEEASIPRTQLRRPSEVVSEEFVGVRSTRRDRYQKYRPADPRVPRELLRRTLSARRMQTLRHIFLRMAEHAFDRDERAGLPIHQVEEMCVKSGLNPSDEFTKKVMDAIAARVDPYGFVDFDAFLKALSYFKERPDAGTEEREEEDTEADDGEDVMLLEEEEDLEMIVDDE